MSEYGEQVASNVRVEKSGHQFTYKLPMKKRQDFIKSQTKDFIISNLNFPLKSLFERHFIIL